MKRLISIIVAAALLFSFFAVCADTSAENQTDTFIADFTTGSEQWEGSLTKYLGYNGDKFGTNAGWSNTAGSIVTKDTYDFGSVFEMSFSLYTDFRNGNNNGSWEDFYVSVGRFKIAICDFQTRIVLYYDGVEVAGKSVCVNDAYISPKQLNYSTHFENGKITIESDTVRYTSDFKGYDPVDGAKVSLTINETWQIWTEYFSSLWIGPVVSYANSFTADFSDETKWLGNTEQLKYDGDKFGNNSGWTNAPASVTAIDKFDFGDNFDIVFSLYTYSKNASYTTNDDFTVSVGKFRIVIADFQTKIKLYYDGTELAGTIISSSVTDEPVKDFEYRIHIEKGNITAESDCLEYKFETVDFESTDSAQVSLKINETWHIWEEYFYEMSVGYAEEEVVGSSFVADFSKSDGWKGLTQYLGYGENRDCFGTNEGWNNKAGQLRAIGKYDFGSSFDVDFELKTDYHNGNTNGSDEEFYINIGKFKLAICDNQTRVELYYDGKKIDGKLICYDSSYVSLRDYKYSAHIEKGNISIKSDILIFTSQYDGFESTDGAEVSIEIRETWQIYSECFSSFSITHKEISENPSSFTADFSDESQWSGLTEYLKYGKNGDFFGNNRGWDNKTGAIRSIADYDFGNEINMEFSLFTSYRNASYTENRDYYVSVGGLKIEICNFQTAVNVYYNGKKADGDIVYKSEPVYPDNGKYDFNYTVDISGNIIVLESELLKFEARLEDFGSINDSKVYVGISETWHIYEGYFGYLRINAEKEKYENGGDILYTRFENTDLWQKSEMSELINTVKQVFPKDYGWDNKTGRLSTEKVYDFSSEYTAFFGLNTYNLNESYKNDFEENKNSTDYRLNIGSISVEINYFQNGISVSKDGFRLKSVLSDKISYDSKEYDYAVTVSAGKITVSQLKGDRELLKLECGLGDSSAADDVFVSLEVCETWQIYDGNFSYLIVADKSHGIKNARSFFDGIDSQKYDWTQDAFGGGEFSSDFTDKTFWIGNITEYIDTENKKFAPDYGWENKTGEITTAKWYNFGPDFKMEFKLFTSYINDANKNSALEEKYKFADYSVGVGKFRIDIRYFQNGMAIYYDNELLGEVQKPEPSYYDKDLSYIFIIRNGEITLRQMNGADTLLELSMDFSGYDLSKARVSISVNESWQVYNGYFKSVTASSLMSYDSEYTFNAAEDIGKILEDEEPERALIKSQWIVKQKTSVSGWNYDQLSARSNISGFYSSVSTDPQPVPVINVQCGDYSSQVGIYNSQLILRANFPSGNERTTALCFESPADGKIWIHDPEYGLISVLERINGTDTWCINSSDTEVKSIHLAIYKNDEKIWPSDSGEYLFANSTHPSVSSAVTNVSFPELVIDVRQGDMIYFTVRPEHYKVSDRTILSTNPTVISLNPQIDYISVTGEMKFNTGREITEEETDADISGLISEKKAAMNYLEEIRDNHMLYIAVCAAAVLAVGCGVTVTLICVRKRRAKV